MILTGIGILSPSAVAPASLCCFVQCFTTNSTWTRCPGTVCIEVVSIGAGGGGRTGQQFSTNPGRSTGGPGGGAGGVSICTLTTGFGGTQSVVIGTGGPADTAGGASCFGALVCAGGGGAGGALSSAAGVGSSTASGGGGGAGNAGTSSAGGGAKACSDALPYSGNSQIPENSGNDGSTTAGFPGGGGGGGGRSACAFGWFGCAGLPGSGGTICGITLGSGGTGSASFAGTSDEIGGAGSIPGGGGGGGGTQNFATVVRTGGAGGRGLVQVVQYYTPVTPVLDTYPSALEAYSVRLLRTAYAGNAIRVRRSSDNSEQNIGFVDGYLDTASLLTFVGAGNGFITTWYDQSGNSRNITQTTAGNQPRIVTSGVLLSSNGKATVSFGTASDDWWLNMNGLGSQSTISLFATWTITDGPTNGGVYGPSTNNVGVGLEIIQNAPTNQTLVRINGTQRITGSTTASRLWTSATQTVSSLLGNSTSVTALKNNASVTMANSSAMPTLNSGEPTSLGRYYDAVSYNMNGNIQEWIVWTSDQTSNSSAINTNINSYYGTY